jgi:hypothetical protein
MEQLQLPEGTAGRAKIALCPNAPPTISRRKNNPTPEQIMLNRAVGKINYLAEKKRNVYSKLTGDGKSLGVGGGEASIGIGV